MDNHDSCKHKLCNVKDSTYCYANFCVSCKLNLGYNNSRQYCCKTYCPYEYLDEADSNDTDDTDDTNDTNDKKNSKN